MVLDLFLRSMTSQLHQRQDAAVTPIICRRLQSYSIRPSTAYWNRSPHQRFRQIGLLR